MDQAYGFTGDDGGDVEISGGFPGSSIFGGDRSNVLDQFDLASQPAGARDR